MADLFCDGVVLGQVDVADFCIKNILTTEVFQKFGL
jgi:hypothetical protein